MDAAISESSIYIEISSDEDASSDDEISMGLNDSIPTKVFEKFLHKSSLFGITDDRVRNIRCTFRNASSHFLSGDFVSYICGVLVRINKDNAQQIMEEVDHCLFTERINYMSPKWSQAVTVPFSSSQTKVSPIKLTGDLENAKRTLVNFFNTHINRVSGDKLKSNNLHKSFDTQNSLVTNKKYDTSGSVIPHSNGIRDRTEADMQNIGPPGNSIGTSVKTHQAGQYAHKQGVNYGNNSSLNDTVKHNVTTSSSVNSSKSLSDLSKSANDCKGATCSLNSKCSEEICDDDDSDVVILSVIHHSRSAVDSHQARAPSASTSRPSYNQVTGQSLGSAEDETERKRNLLIKSIRKRLIFYDKEIKRLMETELTLDEMDNSDSSYIQESKLKSKYSRLYKKLCKLEGSRDGLDDSRYLRIKIEGSPYPEINREAEKHIQLKKKFPDFFDIKSVVSNANKVYKLGLKTHEEVDIAQDVFSEIGNKLQMKRKKEFARYSGSFLTDEANDRSDPASKDHNLRKKLKRNKKISISNTEKLFKHYSRMQYLGCENGSSSNDEDVERTMVKRQRKLIPTKVEHSLATNVGTLEPEVSHKETASSTEDKVMPSLSTCKEMTTSNSRVEGAQLEANSKEQIHELENSKSDRNSQLQYVKGSNDCVSIGNACASISSTTKSIGQQLVNYNGNCYEENCTPGVFSGLRDGLQSVRTEFRKEIQGKFNIGNSAKNAGNKESIPKSDKLSSSIIVID